MKNKSLKNVQPKPISMRLSISSTTSESFRISGTAHIGFNKRTERIKPLEGKNEKIIS